MPPARAPYRSDVRLACFAFGLEGALGLPWDGKAAGKPAELIVAPGYNHYETGETIGHPYAVLGRAAMAMMGLNKG